MFGDYIYAPILSDLWPHNTFLFDSTTSNHCDKLTGRNALHGFIPGFFRLNDKTSNLDCSMSFGPMRKLGLAWLSQELRMNVEPLADLGTLSLRKYESGSLILCLFRSISFLRYFGVYNIHGMLSLIVAYCCSLSLIFHVEYMNFRRKSGVWYDSWRTGRLV